ncbi:MAG: lipocalin family protein [Prevotella sp.]|nr:lipocalin family protein [Prevotella sp.]MDD7461452.1 hypothetical protein [Prevotellaceae bacterium]MDY3364789.1 hypothetical protein [Prevotella sp.]
MQKIRMGVWALIAMLTMVACQDKKNNQNEQLLTDAAEQQDQVPDSTIYGVCGEETGMHTLQVITLQGDTLQFVKDVDEEAAVHGGLMVGDKVAVIAHKNNDGEQVATTVVNITTLLGKWTSIDKNFELREDGSIKSHVAAESKVWTSWKLYNGKLLLNRDTFDIHTLGADSLYLESREGIFTYARQK